MVCETYVFSSQTMFALLIDIQMDSVRDPSILLPMKYEVTRHIKSAVLVLDLSLNQIIIENYISEKIVIHETY